MAAEQIKMRRYISTKETLSYALSVGGNALSGGFLGTWGTYFYVNILRVNYGWLSGLLAIRGVWDTVNDPFMGAILDKTRTRFGKMRPYLVATPLPSTLLSVMLCISPLIFEGASPNSIPKFVFLAVVLFLQETIGTIGGTAYGAAVTVASPNPLDRQRLYTAGSFSYFLLSGIPGMIISAVIDLNRNGVIFAPVNTVFSMLGASSSALGGLMYFVAIFNLKERVAYTEQQPSILESFKYLSKNRPLICLVAKGVLGTFSSLGSTFGTYYYADVLGAASYRSICGVASFVVGAFAFSYIPFFKKHWNNRQIDIIVSIGRFVPPAIAFSIGMVNKNYTRPGVMVPIIAIWNAINAVFDGVNTVVPSEMMAETVDYMEWKNGVRSEGLNFAASGLITKLVGTLNSSITLFIISKIGYVAGKGVRQQSSKTNMWLWAMFSIIPQALGIIDCIPILFYNITGETRETMFRELEERRHKRVEATSGEALG